MLEELSLINSTQRTNNQKCTASWRNCNCKIFLIIYVRIQSKYRSFYIHITSSITSCNSHSKEFFIHHSVNSWLRTNPAMKLLSILVMFIIYNVRWNQRKTFKLDFIKMKTKFFIYKKKINSQHLPCLCNKQPHCCMLKNRMQRIKNCFIAFFLIWITIRSMHTNWKTKYQFHFNEFITKTSQHPNCERRSNDRFKCRHITIGYKNIQKKFSVKLKPTSAFYWFFPVILSINWIEFFLDTVRFSYLF